MEKKELNFKPLTDGLGFHPFSDGLPYAPVSKKTTDRSREREPSLNLDRGAGAVSAGPARFATSLPPISSPLPSTMPRVSVPVAPPATAPAHRTTATPAPAHISQAHTEPVFGLVYLFKRVMAYLVDTCLNSAILIAAFSFILVREDVRPESLISNGMILMSFLFLGFFNWALILAQEVAMGTTVGKRIFGLTLQAPASAIFLRAFFFVPSLGFGALGLLWALFNGRRRCWHDVVVDVQPLELVRL